MDKNAKIYVCGHKGLVGSAIMRMLKIHGFNNLITKSHTELELTDQYAVNNFFIREKPEYVFLCAAKTGNFDSIRSSPGVFFYQNVQIALNVINSAHLNNVNKLLFIGSAWIYPKSSSSPITEDAMLTASIDQATGAYAYSKIFGVQLAEYYNQQFKSNFITIVPCNLYGPGSNYKAERSQVVASLIKKFHDAFLNNSQSVSLWGSGKAIREFVFIDDFADACILLMNKALSYTIYNAGSGNGITIRALANSIAQITGYDGEITYDYIHPDGKQEIILDSSRIFSLGWRPKTSLMKGLKLTYKDFINNAYL